MDRKVVNVDSMPMTNPTYSMAINAGGFLFLAGQIGFDYATGQLVSDDIRDQTRQTMENIRTVLEAAGSSLEQVVNVTVYITDWDKWAAFNKVYGEFFPKDGPAKTTAEVSRLAFDALVEIQVVALA
jgi:2-iminobutanoate/2-iminopropanoate deaminase